MAIFRYIYSPNRDMVWLQLKSVVVSVELVHWDCEPHLSLI